MGHISPCIHGASLLIRALSQPNHIRKTNRIWEWNIFTAPQNALESKKEHILWLIRGLCKNWVSYKEKDKNNFNIINLKWLYLSGKPISGDLCMYIDGGCSYITYIVCSCILFTICVLSLPQICVPLTQARMEFLWQYWNMGMKRA